MKKYILSMFLFLILIVSACSNGVKDSPRELSDVISGGSVLGYTYSVTKTQDTYSWKIGYKDKNSILVENDDNANVLDNYMTAVNNAYLEWIELILSAAYFLIIAVSMLILYKKKRSMLKGYGFLLAMMGAIALYIAVQAYFDLSRIIEDLEYYYLILTR
ncbi:hypothetical protein [Sporosarcina aquimarina]|uniref:Uncharacterized protein n=1 Tax=Sporosarcina aquimarina TaxID=114975 RepID=A0ABU4FY89_9BACL|nr:hypothetical protein [Sporosarcina aquimarina]MDW0109692.1 hypothetical protein [Sporosarcina aquimarina]